jgi:DNA invertase Pin-like site-specific DNA recombinase
VELVANIMGYMRLSSRNSLDENGFDRQAVKLKECGCDKIYSDVISGSVRNRVELDRMLQDLKEGDTIVILSIDRLARDVRHLLEIVDIIKQKGAFLKSINDSWLDTTQENPMSNFLLTVMGAMSQLEREMIKGRIKEGLLIAKDKGVEFGRPKIKGAGIEHAIELYRQGEKTTKQISEIAGISRSTLMRRIREMKSNGQL